MKEDSVGGYPGREQVIRLTLRLRLVLGHPWYTLPPPSILGGGPTSP